MPIDDPNELERIDREIRINELKHEAERLTGGKMVHHEAEDCPPKIAEAFWRNVVEYEKAPWQASFERLVAAGVGLPAPDALNDAALTDKLWEVIRALADMRVFIERTNHLSDRELYTHLWEDSLREGMAVIDGPNSAWHIDILGACSEEDLQISMKYYADEEARQRWKKDFPSFDMPDHQDPPYDRDRLLPQADHEHRPTQGDGFCGDWEDDDDDAAGLRG